MVELAKQLHPRRFTEGLEYRVVFDRRLAEIRNLIQEQGKAGELIRNKSTRRLVPQVRSRFFWALTRAYGKLQQQKAPLFRAELRFAKS